MSLKRFLHPAFWTLVAASLTTPGAAFPQTSAGDDPLLTPTLVVQVRTQSGSTLDTLAVVTLCTFSGEALITKTTIGSQAVFPNLKSDGYMVKVSASGYESAAVETEVSTMRGPQLLIVRLKSDSSKGNENPAAAGIILAPKAQKELREGYEAARAEQYDEAIKHLEKAAQLAPNNADVSYWLGVAYRGKGEVLAARGYWDEALKKDARHVPSMLACGELLIRQNDLEGARKYLDKAVDDAPDSWQAHSLLALALLGQHSIEDSLTQAQRAVELSKGDINSSQLILGQALAADHKNAKAIVALEMFLAAYPRDSQAPTVRGMVARLKRESGIPAVDGP